MILKHEKYVSDPLILNMKILGTVIKVADMQIKIFPWKSIQIQENANITNIISMINRETRVKQLKQLLQFGYADKDVRFTDLEIQYYVLDV